MEQNLFRVFHAFRAQATFPRGEIYVGLALRDNFSGEEAVEQAERVPSTISLQSKTENFATAAFIFSRGGESQFRSETASFLSLPRL